MRTLDEWIKRQCACVHPDASECATIREGKPHAESDPGYYRTGERFINDEPCDCPCHDKDRDENDEDSL